MRGDYTPRHYTSLAEHLFFRSLNLADLVSSIYFPYRREIVELLYLTGNKKECYNIKYTFNMDYISDQRKNDFFQIH